jgi:hypothetical protein
MGPSVDSMIYLLERQLEIMILGEPLIFRELSLPFVKGKPARLRAFVQDSGRLCCGDRRSFEGENPKRQEFSVPRFRAPVINDGCFRFFRPLASVF